MHVLLTTDLRVQPLTLVHDPRSEMGSWIRGPVPGSERPSPHPRARPRIRGTGHGSEGPAMDPRARHRIRGTGHGSEGPSPDPRVPHRIRGSEPGPEAAGGARGRPMGGVHLGPKCAKVQKGANGAKMSATAVVVIKVGIHTVVFTTPPGSKAREITEMQKSALFSLFYPADPPNTSYTYAKTHLGRFVTPSAMADISALAFLHLLHFCALLGQMDPPRPASSPARGLGPGLGPSDPGTDPWIRGRTLRSGDGPSDPGTDPQIQ